MKKFSLSTQVLILMVMVLLFTSTLFGVLIYSKLDSMADSQALKNLSTVVATSRESWSDSSVTTTFTLSSDTDMTIGYIRLIPNEDYRWPENQPSGLVYLNAFRPQNNGDNTQESGEYTPGGNIDTDPIRGSFIDRYDEYKSSNYETIVGTSDESSVEKIVSAGSLSPNTLGTATTRVGGYLIYLAYEVSSDGIVFVAFTNSAYAKTLRRNWMLDISYIFIIVLFVAAFIIFIWSRYYTTRLFRLNTHIHNLSNTNYEISYIDDGRDELAVLSKSVDDMRLTIAHNEAEKKEMLQNVSHDFKTPISVIVGYAEAIKDGVEGVEKADIIIEQADILKNKVYKLLQYNKLEYLSKDKEFEPVLMKSVIEHVLHNYKNLDGIVVKSSLDDTIFLGYEENLYTVVDNIMENAKRYAKSLIRVELKKGVLSFYNDGEPIDEKFLNSAFKAYEMGSKGQFGLGMSIVKKTLDFFQYDLTVSNENPGVMFTIKKKDIINPNKL